MNVLNSAKVRYDIFNSIYENALRKWKFASSVHTVLNTVLLYERAISLTRDWVNTYEPHIKSLNSDIGVSHEMFEWMTMLEQIKLFWLPQFQILIQSQKMTHPLLKETEQVIAKVDQLLNNHFYF